MENTQRTETASEKFERLSRKYTMMRFVSIMSGLEFYSESITSERMVDRWNYGKHPSNNLVGLNRIEGQMPDGTWETV